MTTGAADPWPPRTALFVPASRPERITKAARSGADAVVIDLEDAVGPDEKAAARRAAVRAVDQLRQGLSVVVRVNPQARPTSWTTCWRCCARARGLASS
jgi:citrate lyase subunit beta/citryl-CoA lyase